MTRAFPQGFLWGSATSSFQIEGGIETRGRCIWDDFCRWPGKVLNGDTGDVANDHVHLFKQDVQLMKEMGLDAYRFSVSWPRVLPEGVGEINQAGLDFYDQLVDELLAAGISPSVTLYHWDLPSALQRIGGWAARDTAYRFADYAGIVADRLGDRVKSWITHNEPWVVAFLGNEIGAHAPGWQDMAQALQVSHHVLLSHGLTVPVLCDKGDAETQVGITLNFTPSYPASDSPEDVAAALRDDGYSHRWFLDPVFEGHYPVDMWEYYGYMAPRIAPNDLAIIKQPLDFLGMNYYTRSVVQAADEGLLKLRKLHPEAEYTAMDWEVYPKALTDLLVRLDREYDIPAIYITENGCAYEDTLEADGAVHDAQRVDYLSKHLGACLDAIDQGVPLKGYFVWSLMDNFEWAWGYDRRFGVVYVDFETQQRYLKDSALYFKQAATENAI